MKKILNVHIGEVKVAKNGETLKAILGSCVGIAFIWKEKKICGLAHCLLSESPNFSFEIGGRFVDQAFKSLIVMMKIRDEDIGNVEVVIVGGGDMTSKGSSNGSCLVGEINFKVALREANKRNCKVIHLDGGGVEGRKIWIDSAEFTYKVEKIPRIVSSSKKAV